ncbi:hypothetical protein F2Q70_00045732 [Brassica cretica]|uniref:Uncharacterized protein n=1 Tax=Brassica cretica TaxID=69181 RepID=A0A8S9KDD4_BRACR|nr:hypothetical protein F2Q70_00045732 [Brassica cretica]
MDDAAANEIEQCFKEGETERALRRVVELDIPEEKSSVTDFVLLSSLLQSRDRVEIVSQLTNRMELAGYDVDSMFRFRLLKHLRRRRKGRFLIDDT